MLQELQSAPAEQVLELGIAITQMGAERLEPLGWALREMAEAQMAASRSATATRTPTP